MGRQNPDRGLLPERNYSNVRRSHKGPPTNLPRSASIRTASCQARWHIAGQPNKSLPRTAIRDAGTSPVAIRTLPTEDQQNLSGLSLTPNTIVSYSTANEIFQLGLVNLVILVEVNCPCLFGVQPGIEELVRIWKACALKKIHFHTSLEGAHR